MNTRPILTAEMDDAAKEREQLDATLYAAFFALPTSKSPPSPFVLHDQHAVCHQAWREGDEFDTVLVVLDDSGAAWTLYSFDKYLSGADERRNQSAQSALAMSSTCCSGPGRGWR